MSSVQLLILCGCIVAVTFMILLSLPQSKLGQFTLQVIGWSVAAIACTYVILPIDVLPDFLPFVGWLDDGGAIVAGIGGAVAALSGKEQSRKLQ